MDDRSCAIGQCSEAGAIMQRTVHQFDAILAQGLRRGGQAYQRANMKTGRQQMAAQVATDKSCRAGNGNYVWQMRYGGCREGEPDRRSCGNPLGGRPRIEAVARES